MLSRNIVPVLEQEKPLVALEMMVPILAFFNRFLQKLDDPKGRARVFISKYLCF